MIKTTPDLEKLFKHLSERGASEQVKLTQGELMYIRDTNKHMKELATLGLINIDGGTITKTPKFYEAEQQGFTVWFATWHRDRKRAIAKASNDATTSKYQAIAAKYWRVPIIVSVIALVVSLISVAFTLWMYYKGQK